MQSPTLVYTRSEIFGASAFAISVQIVFLGLLVAAGASRAHITPRAEPVEKVIPIAVKPVMDDLPLLKLGGKKVKTKLPDMWKKNPPVQRFEAGSAPSPQAGMTPESIPSSPLVRPDAMAPPPDAEVAKQVDQVLTDAGPQDASAAVEGAGSPDGVKEGTETDPLKARAVSQYHLKILAWFNARFRQPAIDCETLKGLRVPVTVSVGPDRTVTSFVANRSSGNPVFDAQVKSTMSAIVGQQLPPPPPLYPDLLNTTVSPVFQGKCD